MTQNLTRLELGEDTVYIDFTPEEGFLYIASTNENKASEFDDDRTFKLDTVVRNEAEVKKYMNDPFNFQYSVKAIILLNTQEILGAWYRIPMIKPH